MTAIVPVDGPTVLQPGQSALDAARQHEAAARELGAQAIAAAFDDLIKAAESCAQIAGFELAPQGVRDVLRQVGDQISLGVQTAQSIQTRTS